MAGEKVQPKDFEKEIFCARGDFCETIDGKLSVFWAEMDGTEGGTTLTDTLDSMGGELQVKAQSVACFIRNLEATAAQIKEAGGEPALCLAADLRSPAEVAAMLQAQGLDAVWKDWDPTYDGQTTNRLNH